MSFDRFRETYITECTELLADAETRLMALDPENADKEELNAIFRCAHSIKGGAGAFGFDYITNFTHVLETLLDAMREGQVAPTRETVDMLLRAMDVVKEMVGFASRGATPPAGFGDELFEPLKRMAQSAGGPVPVHAPTGAALPPEDPAAPTTYHIAFTPHENLLMTGNEPLLILRELANLGELRTTVNTSRIPALPELNPEHCYLAWNLELITSHPEAKIRDAFEFVEGECDLVITPCVELASPVVSAVIDFTAPKAVVSASPSAEPASAKAGITSIRVDLEKIDRLVNMVGELVITQAMLNAQTKNLPVEKFPELLRGIDELAQHTRELQEAVMAVRMQPVKSIFSRMPRIVRDIAGALNKDIRLETHGENTEVDKTIIEQLSDPLTHMIRNAADHGVEMPAERVAKGKPAQGAITLNAEHRSGRIVIEISDDGAGLNRERILQKAREKALIAPDAVLTDDETDNLIFHPGFSTAETVSNISGRGVGMDVVKRNIQAMGGGVSLRSNPGKGSIFTISLPLTLAILDGMIVRVGGEFYIIPTISIIETLRPRAGDTKHVPDGNDVLNVRGEFVPVVYLHEVFTIRGAEPDPSKALIVLVESGKDKLGLVVDELIGQQQVVIKSLEANSDPVAGISGATILGDGKVSLILEVSQLKTLGQQRGNREHPLGIKEAA